MSRTKSGVDKKCVEAKWTYEDGSVEVIVGDDAETACNTIESAIVNAWVHGSRFAPVERHVFESEKAFQQWLQQRIATGEPT